jgi:hypothetical protein
MKGKELGGGQKTKVTPQGGFEWINFICGGGLTPTLGPQGVNSQGSRG